MPFLERINDYHILGAPVLPLAMFLLVAFWIQFFLWMLLATARRDLLALAKQHKARPAQMLLLGLLRHTPRFTTLAAGALLALVFTPELPDRFVFILSKVCLLALFIQAGAWTTTLVNHSLQNVLRLFSIADAPGTSALGVMRFFALSLVWIAVALVVLDNLGIQIGPLLTGLGIGGIAIAFALQAILGDIFCSVAIILDKPFEVGDYIVLDPDNQGTVERIGIKTTRVRSLSGEEIVLSNADLLGSRIHNYKRMERRRVASIVGIEYGTPLETMRELPAIIKTIIEGVQGTAFDRCHMKDFAESSYDYEIVYWVLSNDYTAYMDCREKVNLGIIAEFKRLGVDFAFPTRTVHVEVPEGVPITPGIIKHAVTVE